MVKSNIPVTNDYIFQKIFSKKGNESILIDFLIGVLNIPITKVEVQSEVTLEKHLDENKLGRLDIVAIVDNTTIVNIEIQILNKYNFIERSLYYWSGNFYNSLKAGQNYKDVKKTISINIVDYEIFSEGPFHEVARLRRDYSNLILSDKLEIHFIQIPKFLKEKRGCTTKLEQWMQFISHENEKEVEFAMKENDEIKKANDEYEYLTGDEEEKRLAFLRMKAIMDERTLLEGSKAEAARIGHEEGLKKGIKEGKKEGRKEGRKESQEEIAINLLKNNVSDEIILNSTNISREELELLRKKL